MSILAAIRWIFL